MTQATDDQTLSLALGPLDGESVFHGSYALKDGTAKIPIRQKRDERYPPGFPAMTWAFSTEIQADAVAEYHLSPDGKRLVHVATHPSEKPEE